MLLHIFFIRNTWKLFPKSQMKKIRLIGLQQYQLCTLAKAECHSQKLNPTNACQSINSTFPLATKLT